MDNTAKLFDYTIRILSKKRYHSEELKTKLRAKEATKEEIDNILEKLIGYKYINDKEYIEMFIIDRLNTTPQGIRLIKQKLKRKNILTEDIDSIMEKLNIDESIYAKKALKKKLKTINKGQDKQKIKEKLIRFLISRGFNFNTTFEIINNIEIK